MKPSSHLLPLHCRHHNRTTPTSLTVSLSISCSCAATLASSLRMTNFVPCWQATKTLDLCRCKHCPQLLLFSCGSQQNSLGNHTDVATALVLGAQHVDVPPFSWVGLVLLLRVFSANSVTGFVQAVAPNNKTGMITETLVLTRSHWGMKKPTGHKPICRI